MTIRDRIIKWLGGYTTKELRRAIGEERASTLNERKVEEMRAEREHRAIEDELKKTIGKYRMVVAGHADLHDVFPVPSPFMRASADAEDRFDLRAKVYTLRLRFDELCMHMMLCDLEDRNVQEHLYVWSERFADEVRDKAREIAIKALNYLPNVPTKFK
jgi:hypothetical protein